MLHQPTQKLTYLKLVVSAGLLKPATDIFASNPLAEEAF